MMAVGCAEYPLGVGVDGIGERERERAPRRENDGRWKRNRSPEVIERAGEGRVQNLNGKIEIHEYFIGSGPGPGGGG